MQTFCIIGLGRFGQTVARELARAGHQVLVIDIDPEIVNSIADEVTSAVVGDPTNESVLRTAGIRDYDCAVICTSQNINDSILITILAKDMGIKKVVVRAASDSHKRVLERVGADMVVFPEQDMGERLARRLSLATVRDYFELFDGCSVVELAVPHAWIGHSITEVHVRRKYGVDVLAIRRANGETLVSPHPDTVFNENDSVSIVGREADIDRIARIIK